MFYAVKEAAIRDALAMYKVADKGILQRLFSHNPLPEGGYPGTLGGLKAVGHVGADVARDLTLGSPIDLANELSANKYRHGGSWPKALGQQVKNFYTVPGHGLGARAMQALSLGLPAFELGHAAFGDRSHRGERLGGSLAGIATSPFVARLGIPGALIQAPAVAAGKRIGKLFDPTPAPPTNPPDYTSTVENPP